MTEPCPWEAIINNLPADDAALARQATRLQRLNDKAAHGQLVIQVGVTVDHIVQMSQMLPLLKETGRKVLGHAPVFALVLEKVSR